MYDSVRLANPGERADFSFLKIKSRKNAFNTLPAVQGSCWMPKPIVAFLLETKAITWDDITHSLQASGHIPRGAFRRALDQMEAAWSDDQAHLAKISINSMVGLLCRNNAVYYSCKSSHDPLDAIGSNHSQFFGWGPEGDFKFIHDFIWTKHVLDNSSTRPIHDWVMGHEYVLIAKIRHLCSTIDSRYFRAVKTDCVLFQSVARKNLHVLQKATEQRYEDGSPVYRFISDGLKPLLANCERMPMEARPPEDLPDWETIAADELEEHVLEGR